MANDGVLSCTQLQEIQLNLNARWSDNAYAATRGVVKAGTIEALLREQTAVFREVEDKTNKSNSVELEWLEDCPIGTKACDVDCAPDAGVEFGDNCFTIDCDDCIQANTITVDETTLAASSLEFDEFVSRGMYRIDQAIAEALNITAINLLDTVAGDNNYLDTWGGAVVPATSGPGVCTTMTANIWVDPTNYLTFTSGLNNYSNPYYIGGSITSKYALTNNPEAADAIINGGSVNVNGLKTYFDLRAMDQEIGSNKLFMVNRGEFAYVNCYHYPTIENMTNIADGVWAYRMRSPILSDFAGRDIFHDVVYRTVCTATDNVLRRTHSWEVLNRFALEQSPADCAGDNNVLCFSCV